MAGVGIYAGLTGHSTSVPFHGIAVGASWMEQSDREQKGAKMKDDLEDILSGLSAVCGSWDLDVGGRNGNFHRPNVLAVSGIVDLES